MQTKERYQIKMKFICDETLPMGVYSPIYQSFVVSPKFCKNSLEIRTANGKLIFLFKLVH